MPVLGWDSFGSHLVIHVPKNKHGQRVARGLLVIVLSGIGPGFQKIIGDVMVLGIPVLANPSATACE